MTGSISTRQQQGTLKPAPLLKLVFLLTPIVVPVVADPAPQGNTSPDALRKLPVDRAEKVAIKVRAIAKERPIPVSVTNAPHRVCKARKKPGVGNHIIPGAWPMTKPFLEVCSRLRGRGRQLMGRLSEWGWPCVWGV